MTTGEGVGEKVGWMSSEKCCVFAEIENGLE
jgi:hypothetical protein